MRSVRHKARKKAYRKASHSRKTKRMVLQKQFRFTIPPELLWSDDDNGKDQGQIAQEALAIQKRSHPNRDYVERARKRLSKKLDRMFNSLVEHLPPEKEGKYPRIKDWMTTRHYVLAQRYHAGYIGDPLPITHLYTYTVKSGKDRSYGPNITGWQDLLKEHKKALTSQYVESVRHNEPHMDLLLRVPDQYAPTYEYRWRLSGVFAPLHMMFRETNELNVFRNQCDLDFGTFAARDVSTFLGGVFLKELVKLEELIRHPFGKGTKVVVSFLKNAKYFAKNPQKVADAWLHFQYAIKPTVNDLKDICFIFSSLLEVGKFRMSKKHKVFQQSITYDIPFTGMLSGTGEDGYLSAFCVRVTEVTKCERKYRSLTYFSMADMSATKSALARFGLDIAQLPANVWEATPWSFLGDYFFSFSDYIDSLKKSPVVAQHCYGFRVERLTRHTSWRLVPNPEVIKTLDSSQFARMEIISNTLSGSAIQSICSREEFVPSAPAILSKQLDTSHLLNIIALIFSRKFHLP